MGLRNALAALAVASVPLLGGGAVLALMSDDRGQRVAGCLLAMLGLAGVVTGGLSWAGGSRRTPAR